MKGPARHLVGCIDAVFPQLYHTAMLIHKGEGAQLHAPVLGSDFKTGIPWILPIYIIFSVICHARQCIIVSINQCRELGPTNAVHSLAINIDTQRNIALRGGEYLQT